MHDTINRLRAKKDDEGFTLIELLVVVVIIGVLVAIAVPVYLNYRQGAADKSAQSDVRGGISAVEQFYTSNGNAYPAAAAEGDASVSTVTSVKLVAPAGGTDGIITLSDKTKLNYVPIVASGATAASSYKLCATNTGGSGKYYVYDSSLGGSVKAGTVATAATCS
jgi:type IV pilus assembly protein PilA